jgi:hypothetical protein
MEKSFRYSLDRRLVGPQSRFGDRGEEKISQPILILSFQVVLVLPSKFSD